MTTEADVERLTAAVEPVLKAVRVIREKHGKATSLPLGGTMVCPKCSGVLHYRIAPNGHTRGRCDTDKCLSWIQ